jgi:photosystem II stability/assembly factor-like uncharacterized protein
VTITRIHEATPSSGPDIELLLKEAKRRARLRRLAIVAITVLAVAGLVAGLLLALGGGSSAAPPSHGQRAPLGRPATALASNASSARWSLLASFPSRQLNGQEILCPSARRCVLLGTSSSGVPGVLWSANDGKTWSPEALSLGLSAQPTMSCSSASLCMVAGVSWTDSRSSGYTSTVRLERSTDVGKSWTLTTLKEKGAYGSAAVACGSPTSCVVLVSPWQNNGWTTGPQPTFPLLQLASTDAGSSWSTSKQFASLKTPSVAAVACPTATTCELVGSATSTTSPAFAARTMDGGTTWGIQKFPGRSSQPSAVSCSTASFCVAVSSLGGLHAARFVTHDGGTTWATSYNPSFGSSLNSVTCLPSGTCYGAGDWAGGKVSATGLLEVSYNVGSSWTRVSIPSTVTSVEGVSCSASTCLALLSQPGNVSAVVHLRGSHAVGATVPLDSWFQTSGFTCSTVSMCLAVGSAVGTSGATAAIAMRSNAGRSWSLVRPLGSPAELSGVACPTRLTCVAVGWEIGRTFSPIVLTSNDGGTKWRLALKLGGIAHQFFGVACPSTSTCDAIGSTSLLYRTSDAGRTWRRITFPFSGASLREIACASASLCAIEARNNNDFGGIAFASRDGGLTWARSRLEWVTASGKNEGSFMYGLACTQPASCVAVTSAPAGVFAFAERSTNGGMTWQRSRLPISLHRLVGVSCGTPSLCVAAAASNHPIVLVTTNQGATWGPRPAPGGLSVIDFAWCQAHVCWVAGQADTSGATVLERQIES